MSTLSSIQADVCWSAGFLEGEGSAGLYKSVGDRKRLVLSAVQKDISPLEKLKSLYGGTLSSRSESGIYTWNLQGDAAMYAINSILPYVVSAYKSEQYLKAVESYRNYVVECGRAKNISTRTYKGKIKYDVRISDGGEVVHVGTFSDPSVARAALTDALSSKKNNGRIVNG